MTVFLIFFFFLDNGIMRLIKLRNLIKASQKFVRFCSEFDNAYSYRNSYYPVEIECRDETLEENIPIRAKIQEKYLNGQKVHLDKLDFKARLFSIGVIMDIIKSKMILEDIL